MTLIRQTCAVYAKPSKQHVSGPLSACRDRTAICRNNLLPDRLVVSVQTAIASSVRC